MRGETSDKVTQLYPVVTADTQPLPSIEQVTQEVPVVDSITHTEEDLKVTQPQPKKINKRVVKVGENIANVPLRPLNSRDVQAISLENAQAGVQLKAILPDLLEPKKFIGTSKIEELNSKLLRALIIITLDWMRTQANEETKKQFENDGSEITNNAMILNTDIIERASAPYIGKQVEHQKFKKFLRDYGFEILAEVSKRYVQK